MENRNTKRIVTIVLLILSVLSVPAVAWCGPTEIAGLCNNHFDQSLWTIWLSASMGSLMLWQLILFLMYRKDRAGRAAAAALLSVAFEIFYMVKLEILLTRGTLSFKLCGTAVFLIWDAVQIFFFVRFVRMLWVESKTKNLSEKTAG